MKQNKVLKISLYRMLLVNDMKNVLIISKDLNFYRELNNNFYNVIKIINISCSYKEGLESIISNTPDIIILKIRMQYDQVLELFEKISKQKKYNPLIILISSKNMLEIQNKHSNCIFIKEDNHMMTAFKTIFHYSNKMDIENKIKKELMKMGFEMKNKGDYLIINVIKYIFLNQDVNNLEREIYPALASSMGISEKQIKWNINYSINSIYNTKSEIMCHYLNIHPNEKPTSKLVIFSLLNKL